MCYCLNIVRKLSVSAQLITLLTSYMHKWDIPFSQAQQDSFLVFYRELIRFSSVLGLTHASAEDLPAKHFLDSLLALPFLKKMQLSNVLDIGSGGGFPALPLAVMMGDCHFTLCERNRKKAGFLLSTSSLMGLKNVSIHAGDFTHIAGSFELCTFRALMKVSAAEAHKILKKAPKVLAYKGRLEETEREAQELTKAGFFVHIDMINDDNIQGQRTLLWFSDRKNS